MMVAGLYSPPWRGCGRRMADSRPGWASSRARHHLDKNENVCGPEPYLRPKIKQPPRKPKYLTSFLSLQLAGPAGSVGPVYQSPYPWLPCHSKFLGNKREGSSALLDKRQRRRTCFPSCCFFFLSGLFRERERKESPGPLFISLTGAVQMTVKAGTKKEEFCQVLSPSGVHLPQVLFLKRTDRQTPQPSLHCESPVARQLFSECVGGSGGRRGSYSSTRSDHFFLSCFWDSILLSRPGWP